MFNYEDVVIEMSRTTRELERRAVQRIRREQMAMVGAKFYNKRDGRAVTVLGEYDGHDGMDHPGYDYSYDDNPGSVFWISAAALPIRFTKEKPSE